MKLARSLSLSTLSTGLRLAAALVSFSIVARALGPAGFGMLMLCLSIAALLAIAGSFGLVTYVLRELGRAGELNRGVWSEALSAKLIATSFAFALSLLVLPLLSPDLRWAYVALVVAMQAEAFGEFCVAGLRARERYDVEARLALVSGIVNATGVGVVAWATGSLPAIALTYAFTRLVMAFVIVWRVAAVLGPLQPAPLSAGWRRLKSASGYALDSMLTSAFGQVDSLVLNHFLGPLAVGVHQAGMRIFLAGSQAATVLANVFLPRAARAHSLGADESRREVGRLQLAFLLVGASFGLLLAACGHWLVGLMFGDQFAALGELMPWFGLLFAVKFGAAAWGLVLTASGAQRYRALANAFHWLCVGVGAWFLVPRLGNLGWLLALITGNLVLYGLYAAKTASASPPSARTLGLTAAILVAFLPLLHWPR